MKIKLRNALFFSALFATLVAFASAQGGSFRGTRSRASRLDEDDEEDVGGVLSRLGNFGNKYSTPIENGWKLFNQGRSGSELNKVVNHGAKKQWSWAPSSRPNPKTDWGARSSRAIKNFFNKDVAEEHDEDVGGVLSGLGRLGNFGNKYSIPIENGWQISQPY